MEMDLRVYNSLALKTLNDLGGRKDNLMHMAAGIGGEAGEVLDLVKKNFAYGKALDEDLIVEEVGDLIWYINGLLHFTGRSWEQVLERNVAKLSARYKGGGFDAENAINRDKEAEQAAMGL